MPTKPPSYCSKPGCPRTATAKGRCDTHQRAAWHTTRTSAHERGYGHKWRRLRAAKLAADPVCEICDNAVATQVDHIKAKAHGGTDEWSNLQSACDTCHKAKTAKEKSK